jgi:hypothetical protein
MLDCRARRTFGLALVAGLIVGGSSCSKDEFADRSAVVAVGGSEQTYEVESCGLDEQTVFVVARADDGAVFQGVMGLEDDDATGIPASTGITVDLDATSEDTRVAAFGAESWERRGSAGAPPGSISSAKLRGSRIQIAGEVVPVDPDDAPVPDGKAEPFTVDARCDEVE